MSFVPGGRVLLEPVEEFIRELARRYVVGELSYDPRFFERSAHMLSDEDMLVVPLNQGSHPMIDAYQSSTRRCPVGCSAMTATRC